MNLQDATGTVLLSWLSAYQCDRSLTITLFISAPSGTRVEKPLFSFQKNSSSKLLWDMYICLCLPLQQSRFMTGLSFIESKVNTGFWKMALGQFCLRLNDWIWNRKAYLLLYLRQHSHSDVFSCPPQERWQCFVRKIDACVFIWCKSCCVWQWAVPVWLTAAQYSYSQTQAAISINHVIHCTLCASRDIFLTTGWFVVISV